jgi:Carboxypeptidase regulatory-like domain
MKRALFAIVALFATGVLCVWSQGLQNSITGEVRDTTGAVVVNASVTVTNVATNVSSTVATNGTGAYTVLGLVVGEYAVKAEAPGMQPVIHRNVVVQANQTVRVDFALSPGQVSESVTVNSSASDVLQRTEDAATGLVVSQKQVDNLPIEGRDFISLAQITPGANEAMPGNQNSLGRTQSMNLSVNGQRMFNNNYLLDGVSMIAGFVNGSTFVPSLEALQEISVQTGQYSAAYGDYSGAQVDMIVKSGTNQLHGSFYEYLRNNDLDARQFFDQSAPPAFRYNQFGATVGGPVVIPKLYNGRNKTFFFFAYEGDRTRQLTTQEATDASAAERGGDFSQLLPGKVIKDPYTGQPFPGNVIPASRIAPQALALMQYIPLPNTAGQSLNFINTASSKDDESQYIGRIDEKISDNDTLFFRAADRDAYLKNVTINPNFQSLSYPSNGDYVLSETHIFSASIVNDARLSYIRESTPTKTGREGDDIDPLRDFGISGLNFSNPLIVGIPTASISGYMGTGENFANPRLLFSSPTFQDGLFIQHGKHSLHIGGDFSRWRQDSYSINATNQGEFIFSGQLSGNAFADFLLGLPYETEMTAYLGEVSIHQKHASAYIQDDWRVLPNLTLNLGLRYEYAGSYSDLLGNARNFDWKTLSLFPAPGVTAPLNDPSNDFAPRFGFAYNLKKTGTVIRGGYGIFFTQPTMANVTLLYRNPPRNSANTYITNLADPNLTLANGFVSSALGATAPASLVSIPQDYGPGYAQSWSLNIQQKLPGNWVAEVGYVGSHTLHLDSAHTDNVPPPEPGVVQSNRPLQQWGAIRVFGTDGIAYYDGLVTRLQSTSWHGANILTDYTYSKCLDNKSSASTSAVGNDPTEPQNEEDYIKGEKGRCAIDFTQQFHLQTVYSLPFGKNSHNFAAALIRDWQLSAGVVLHTGPPITITESGNTANTGSGTLRPNRVADGNLPADQRTPQEWFDTSAFVATPPYTFGDSGRGIIEAPGTKIVNLSLVRRLVFHERQEFDIRADAFNALNTTQFGIPGYTLGTASFGQISSTYPARNIQFGLRYAF